ncbi:hypothetical protein LPL9_2400 [Lacticaseibacillus paracasei]|nr:hypothetical protein LPL9_2400 [Lacticaseibacillus paracasei]QHV91124.1 hypothetical protein EOK76_g0654 [Lacticaseibacillus paracasei]
MIALSDIPKKVAMHLKKAYDNIINLQKVSIIGWEAFRW